MLSYLKNLNHFIWGIPMLVLLLGTHIFFTFRLKFIQKKIIKGIRLSVTPEKGDADGISGFAALTTTLAATLGTGNIIGISTAIALGGPGALFWCWLTGILGMATTYAECYLSVLFHKKSENDSASDIKKAYVGGPMYVIEHGLHNKKAAKLYAFCLLLACFGVGCLTQANAITDSATGIWNISPSILGIGASVLTGFVIIGGIQSISKVCMKLIPALSLFFVSGCILLMVLNFEYVPESIMLIIKNAFTPTAIGGGIAGGGLQLAARYGVSRGLFTNEAGLGTASVFAAASNSSSPFRQALISMTATFWDTVILCAITGIVIVAHLIKFPVIPEGYRIGGLTAAAFSTIPFGEVMLTLALIGFAIATLIGWSYLGEQAIVYLFGKNMLSSFHLVYICMIFIGAVMSLELVWELTDFFNALLIFPNLYALYKLKKYISFKS